jgi:hypothetical protein
MSTDDALLQRTTEAAMSESKQVAPLTDAELAKWETVIQFDGDGRSLFMGLLIRELREARAKLEAVKEDVEVSDQNYDSKSNALVKIAELCGFEDAGGWADQGYVNVVERKLSELNAALEAANRALDISRNQTKDAFERVAREHNENVELRAEKQRMDWLIANQERVIFEGSGSLSWIPIEGGSWDDSRVYQTKTFDLREAIDKAMAAKPE